MPQYLDADVPMARRRDSKDAKIYRTCFGYHGPNIISKYICDASRPSSVNDLSTEETKNEQTFSTRFMHQADPLGIDDFGVPYSTNKKQRWNFMDNVEEGMFEPQGEEYRVRVSVIRSKITKANKENDTAPENYIAQTPGNQVVTKYCTYDEDEIIEKGGKRVTFASVSRKPNPPRHRRGRLIRHATTISSSEVNAEDENDVVGEGTVHILYKEQCFDMTNREVNMNKRMKREKNVKFSQHRHSKRFPNDETEDAYGAVCDELGYDDSLSSEAEDWRCYADVNYPILQPLENFVITTQKTCKGRRKRRRANTDDATNNNYRTAVAEDDKPSVSARDAFIPLTTITFPLAFNGSFSSVIESSFPNARKIARFQPSTYAVHMGGDSCEVLESLLPKGFVGTLFIQDAGLSEGTQELRCILNESELARSLSERRLDNKLLQSLNEESQITTLSPIGHMPKTAFVERQVNTQTIAAFQSLSNLAVKASRCDPEMSSSADIIVCRSCYIDDEPCISLACNHYFCRQCWTCYILSCLRNDRVPITCPEYGCDQILELDHMMTIMPATQCVIYAKMVLNNLLNAPENFLCIRCSSVIHIVHNNQERKAVACSCGIIMCSQCKMPLHAPLDCAAAKQYSNIREINGHIYPSINDDIQIIVKQCPSCKRLCQRWTGCNHMQCPCGIEFCYRCGGLWLEGDHGTCEEKHMEKTLHDEPQVFSGSFSLRVFRQCQKLRSFITASNLFPIRAMLRRTHLPVSEKKRLLQCYVELCQLMEVITANRYIERRRRRRLKSLSANQTLISDRADVSLEFLKTSLEVVSSDRRSPKAQSQFLIIIRKIDNVIAAYMSRYFPV